MMLVEFAYISHFIYLGVSPPPSLLLLHHLLLQVTWNDAAGYGFDDVGHDGDGDKEARDVIEDERRRGRVRVFEGAPHAFPERQVARPTLPVLRKLVFLHAFGILPLPVFVVLVTTVADDVGHDAEKRQLVVVS